MKTTTTIIKYLDKNTILHEISVSENGEDIYKDDVEISSMLHHSIANLIENLRDLELFTFIDEDYYCIFVDESNKDDFQDDLELLNKAIAFIYKIDVVQYKNKEIKCFALLDELQQYAVVENCAIEYITFYNYDRKKIVEHYNLFDFDFLSYQQEIVYNAMIYSLNKFNEWKKNNEKYKANLYLVKEFMCNTEFYYYNSYTQKIDLYSFEYRIINNKEEEFLVNEHTQEVYLIKDYLLNDNENRVLACCIFVGKEEFEK